MHARHVVAAAATLVAGVLMFARGFFPLPAVKPGAASSDSAPLLPGMSGADMLAPRFDRLVFVVVDAFRE